MNDQKTIASFSMEFGLLMDERKSFATSHTGWLSPSVTKSSIRPNLATPHAGGLGVLEGDNFLTAQDLGQPYVAVSLLHQNGYVRQDINQKGEQLDLDEFFDPSTVMRRRKETVIVNIDDIDREVYCYQYTSNGADSQKLLYVSVDGMDTHLYRGDKIAKSIVLGIGGVRILKKLGYDLDSLHFKINESNTCLAIVEVLRMFEDEERVKEHSSFITHTTLPHGHDVYDIEYLKRRLKNDAVSGILSSAGFGKFVTEGKLNLSQLVANLSGNVFAVSKQHREIARPNFPNKSVGHLTNGVHWSHISDRKRKIFDKYLGSWRTNPELFRESEKIPLEEFQEAHELDKSDLIDYIKSETGIEFSLDRPISGVARRQTAYKRPLYLFSNIERLKSIATRYGLQHVQAGKAHPEDVGGKNEIREYHAIMQSLRGDMRLTFIKNYNLENHRILLNGIDFMIYSPIEDQEACGTSYMKAMWAGIPVLGSLAGGFTEYYVDGVNSFAFRNQEEFYDKLEFILREYEKNRLAEIRRNAVACGANVSSVRAFQEFISKVLQERILVRQD
ncbi:MAG: alpha-glucan family phosphorylase [Thaumarchaeota archaeon]|nr:alpha-glucan family phosphorylase [Nitrososphaerota archaeon]